VGAEPANLIAGDWRPAISGETFADRNPSRPDEVVATLPLSGAADVDAAVSAACEASVGWARTPAPQRGDLLVAAAQLVEGRADELALRTTREMGKPIREARGEWLRAATILRYHGGEGYRPTGELYAQSGGPGRILTSRRPVGVVGLITPWNFPTAIPAWKLAPALVHGNVAVLKAAQDAPLTALALAECLVDAGLPAGVLNVVAGPGSTVGAALVEDPRVHALSFTGSVATGTAIRDSATARGARVQCELGGQNPAIVTADADLDRAVQAVCAGAFWSAGQKCTATRRVYVERDVYGAFRDRFLTRTAAMRVGDPLDPATEVGPLVNESQLRDVLAAIERGVADGGELIAGGGQIDRDGWFVEPTVFENVADEGFLSCEEVFGPVVSLYPFDDLDEALERANAVPLGLSAAIFTSDLAAAASFGRELRAGILHVNSQTAGAEVHVPFGGLKGSAWGPHEQGRSARDFYTDVVTIYEDE
jgi:aldehyde dehydrogenase (NAD+)